MSGALSAVGLTTAAEAGSAAAISGATAGFSAASGAAVAGSSLFSLGNIGLYSSLASSLIGGIGSLSSGNSSAAAAKYNSEVATQNAQIAQQNATWASQAGEQQVGEQSQKTKATIGGILAAQAANGLDVNKGSAVDVRSSAAALGELSALNIRSNAARQVYGAETQETSYKGQSNLDTFEADQSQLAGEVGAAGSVLGGVGNAGLNYAKYIGNNTINPGF